jgi:glutathione S-transferase
MKFFAGKVNIEIAPEAIVEAEQNLPKLLRTMDTWIAELGFIAGDAMTIADLLAFCELSHCVVICNYNIKTYSNVSRWYREMLAIPEVAEVSEALFSMGKKLNSGVVLYGFRLSQPSNAVEALLQLAGIPYTFHNIDLIAGD